MRRLDEKLQEIYSRFFKKINRNVPVLTFESMTDSVSRSLIPKYSMQDILRPLFGKGNSLPPDIGNHPDFNHLLQTDDLVYCPITTMFMDMEGSTRLNLLFSPEEVFDIKNSYIRAAIEIVRAFDGHVHRIMGDAVMAYFGGINKHPKMGIVDGINCASVLCYFIENVIRPKIQEATDTKDPFGIRIGLDFGPKDKVLWGAYGHPGMEEVTATSFYVDVASKLQHSAGRNQIMIGQSLQETMDFPMELLEIKTVQKNGEIYPEPFLKPNMTDREDKELNYKQYILKWKEYIRLTPINQDRNVLGPTVKDVPPLPLLMEVRNPFNDSTELLDISPAGLVLQKGKKLIFKVGLNYCPVLSYNLKFSVENHGEDAKKQAGESRGNHHKNYTINTQKEHQSFIHQEYTAYTGLHYLTAELYTIRGLEYRTVVGIYIE